jgi:hypothetical protein
MEEVRRDALTRHLGSIGPKDPPTSLISVSDDAAWTRRWAQNKKEKNGIDERVAIINPLLIAARIEHGEAMAWDTGCVIPERIKEIGYLVQGEIPAFSVVADCAPEDLEEVVRLMDMEEGISRTGNPAK